MYGSEYTAPKGGTSFVAGINEGVSMKFFGIENCQTQNYSGPVLDIIFKNKKNDEMRDRIFPVDPAKLPSQYQTYVQNKNKAGKKDIMSQSDYNKKQYADFSARVRHYITQFVPETTFDVESTAWFEKAQAQGASTTFQGFVGMCLNVLTKHCPDYAKQEGRLLLGYKQGSQYLTVPVFDRDSTRFFTLDPDLYLELGSYSKLTFDKPAAPGGHAVNPDDLPSGPEDMTPSDVPVEVTSGNPDDLPF